MLNKNRDHDIYSFNDQIIKCLDKILFCKIHEGRKKKTFECVESPFMSARDPQITSLSGDQDDAVIFVVCHIMWAPSNVSPLPH